MIKKREYVNELIAFKKDIIRSYNNAGLTSAEKETVKRTIKRKSLIDTARKYSVSQAGVYRIRDRAVRKMCKYINDNSKRSQKMINS